MAISWTVALAGLLGPCAAAGALRPPVAKTRTALLPASRFPRESRWPSRRYAIASGAAAVFASGASFASAAEPEGNPYRKLGSERPGNNYYFPMARYRYAPRILRAWIALDELGLPALKAGDWEGVKIVQERMEDATTAMPLFTSSIEGSRSTKRKKKSDTQKAMAALTESYTKACKELLLSINRQDQERAIAAFAAARESLGEYRRLAKIDSPDGGAIIPENSAEGRGGVPDAQYVVPAFQGGGKMNREDFRKLRN